MTVPVLLPALQADAPLFLSRPRYGTRLSASRHTHFDSAQHPDAPFGGQVHHGSLLSTWGALLSTFSSRMGFLRFQTPLLASGPLLSTRSSRIGLLMFPDPPSRAKIGGLDYRLRLAVGPPLSTVEPLFRVEIRGLD